MSIGERTPFVSCLAVLVWQFCLATGAWGAQAVSQQPFKETFGLVLKFSQGQPARQITMLEDIGITWVRDTVMWADMEPSPGEYNEFPAEFKKRLTYYRTHRIKLIFMLAYGNGRAYPASKTNPLAPIDPKAFGRYAARVAEMLKDEDVHFVLEVWNEPHNFVIRPLAGGEWDGSPPSPWVTHYVSMVNEAFKSVKAVDPNIQVINCEDVWAAHYWFLENPMLPRNLDGIGIHPYSGKKSPSPEVAGVYPNKTDRTPFQLVDADRSFTSAVRRLRERATMKLGRTPHMYITEWGWRIGEESPNGPLTVEQISSYLPRAFIAAAYLDVKVLCWFSSFDAVDGPHGLIALSGEKRATYIAYQTMSKELGDMFLVDKITGKSDATQGIQAYLFKSPSGARKIALWSADHKTRALKIDKANNWIKAVDHLGRTVDAKSLSTHLEVDGNPVYISVNDSDDLGWATKLSNR
jgi:Cellulase (glycosyl hydrolase family 5)